jgi:hypothetical protein
MRAVTPTTTDARRMSRSAREEGGIARPCIDPRDRRGGEVTRLTPR